MFVWMPWTSQCQFFADETLGIELREKIAPNRVVLRLFVISFLDTRSTDWVIVFFDCKIDLQTSTIPDKNKRMSRTRLGYDSSRTSYRAFQETANVIGI